MASRVDLMNVEELLNQLLSYAIQAGRDLPSITLKKIDFETFTQFNPQDHRGNYYFKNVQIKKGNY